MRLGGAFSLAWRPGRAYGWRHQSYTGPLARWALGLGPLELRRHHGAADGPLWRLRRWAGRSWPTAFECLVFCGFHGLLGAASAWFAAVTLRATLTEYLGAGQLWPQLTALAGLLLGALYGAFERRRCCS